MFKNILCVITLFLKIMCCDFQSTAGNSQTIQQVFGWKQIGYNISGILYSKSIDNKVDHDKILFNEDNLTDSEKFFIQENNVPVGFEVYGGTVFITVPRRRYGIPSTLNYVKLGTDSSPVLIPYPPESSSGDELLSAYRPRVDACERLWVVDTGLLEVPGARKQVKPPAIVVYDLKTNQQILRHQIKASDLDERTSGGMTSITVDVLPNACEDAYAYVTDLATTSLFVFSLKNKESWRIQDETFAHDPNELNLTAAGVPINWKDGIFSVTLSDPDFNGKRTLFYHPFISTVEYSVETDVVKNKSSDFANNRKVLGSRGRNTQSGSHDYHSDSKVIFFANVAQDAILCWNIDTPLVPNNVAIAIQDKNKLPYISDLKVIGDDVWVLVNKMPRFVYSGLNPTEFNFFIHRANVRDLIQGTVCDRS